MLENVTFKRNAATGGQPTTDPGQMVITQTVEYFYDMFNRWTMRDVDVDGNTGILPHDIEQFMHDGQEMILHGVPNPTNPTNPAWRWMMRGPDQDMVLFEARTVNRVFLGDHLNTIRDVVAHDGTGWNIVNHLTIDSFGNRITETNGAIEVMIGLGGRPYDEVTGLQNHLHRWYQVDTGRWMSEDPIGFAGGDANLNRFVGNSPSNAIDPNGLQRGITLGGDRVVGGQVVERGPRNQDFPLPPLAPTVAGPRAAPFVPSYDFEDSFGASDFMQAGGSNAPITFGFRINRGVFLNWDWHGHTWGDPVGVTRGSFKYFPRENQLLLRHSVHGYGHPWHSGGTCNTVSGGRFEGPLGQPAGWTKVDLTDVLPGLYVVRIKWTARLSSNSSSLGGTADVKFGTVADHLSVFPQGAHPGVMDESSGDSIQRFTVRSPADYFTIFEYMPSIAHSQQHTGSTHSSLDVSVVGIIRLPLPRTPSGPPGAAHGHDIPR